MSKDGETIRLTLSAQMQMDGLHESAARGFGLAVPQCTEYSHQVGKGFCLCVCGAVELSSAAPTDLRLGIRA